MLTTLCECVYACVCTFVCEWLCVYMCVRACVCACVCMCVYVCMCGAVYVHACQYSSCMHQRVRPCYLHQRSFHVLQHSVNAFVCAKYSELTGTNRRSWSVCACFSLQTPALTGPNSIQLEPVLCGASLTNCERCFTDLCTNLYKTR
jgi:hypothetical protein